MNSLMHRAQDKDIGDLPAAIDKFEREVARFKERTGLEFPEMLKMPILLQMVPPVVRREVEIQFRISGVDKTYGTLSRQLVEQANESRYRGIRRDPNAVDIGTFARAPEAGQSKPESDIDDREWAEYVEGKNQEYEHWKSQCATQMPLLKSSSTG